MLFKPMGTDSLSSKKLDAVLLLNVIFVFIVLLLHHGVYTHDFIRPLRELMIHKYLQKFAVGGFLFLSGYKLTKSKISTPKISFLRSRFLRIYPLYFIALLAHTFTVYLDKYNQLPNIKTFLAHIFLVQSVIPHLFGGNYFTIWFVSILLFCYLFFLATRKFTTSNLKLYGLSILATIIIICLVRNTFFEIDIQVISRFFELYIAFFAIGMLYAVYENKIHALIRFQPLLSFICIVISVISWIILIRLYIVRFDRIDNIYLYMVEFFSIIATTVPIYLAVFHYAPKITVKSNIAKVLEIIGSSSFCVFLFHRPIWSLMTNFQVNRTWLQSIYILLFGVPTIFFLSYQIQYIYSKLVKQLERSRPMYLNMDK